MFQNLALFQTAAAMARHAGQRQAVTARNIANADTPGFRALATRPFAETYRAAGSADLTLHTTRPGHIGGMSSLTESLGGITEIAPTEQSPNGNSVAIETEMVNAAEIQREHEQALAIYRHGLSVLRTALGR